MSVAGSASSPQWYKDAVIYELNVRTFFDSNGDGIGDFAGLTQKLGYLEELGVTFVVRPEGLDERGGAERSHRPEVVKKPRIRRHILLFSPQASRAPPVRGKD